ncbi:hypothetical protein J5H92_33905, partial [Pseudomonas aeruginosa]|nr:hypothetical protein [Pseudomonas aeruginosa]
LDCSAGFRLLNFEETVMWRENPSGGEPIKSRSFDMTKDGFMFLVMGFRGKGIARLVSVSSILRRRSCGGKIRAAENRSRVEAST